ncbi:MAG: glycosyltransferase family 2 protein, partial [Candidatus Dormibacteraeota bacterium]|nr:glycosyltransferase family 2 protein [Candidatus Dormibacteraeota bacterium]
MPATSVIALIIPALNEAEIIGRVVTEMRSALPTGLVGRILVVDNGSTDETALVAASAGAEVIAEPRRGYGRACAAGVAAAKGAQYLVFLDGDGADMPADLPAVLEPILSGSADLVVGVRRRREAKSMTPWQLAGNRVAAIAIRTLYGVSVSDLGPFRAIRRSHLLLLGMSEMTYGWSTEMVVKSLRAGLRYREV